MLMFDKVHIVVDAWTWFWLAFGGYYFGRGQEARRTSKILTEVTAEYAQLARKMDFQLRSRGYEGLSPEDMVSKVAVPDEQLKLED